MYTMKEVCQIVGWSYETLKYYCKEGLIPNVKRDKNNYRVFDENNIEWIKGLQCLKKCGMSLKDMRMYLDYCMQGPGSIPERVNMKMVAENYACAYREVIEILKYTNQDDVNKIPSEKLLLWLDNMKEDYKKYKNL